MQVLRKGEWLAITQVKVLSPEICLTALGQGLHHLEASSAARDKGECVSHVPDEGNLHVRFCEGRKALLQGRIL